MSKFIKTITLVSLAFVLLVIPCFDFAQAGDGDSALSTAYSKIEGLSPDKEFVKNDNLSEMTGKMIKAVLGIIGSISLIVFLYSGIIWMTSQGNEKKIKQAENGMIWAAIGLFVIFTSYVMVNYVISNMAI
jgi:hypothetical protein